jgi:hypothetical protein
MPVTELHITQLVDLARCPARYFLKHQTGLPQAMRAPLEFGKALHFALSAARHRGLEAGVSAFSLQWSKSLEAGLQADDKHSPALARGMMASFLQAREPNVCRFEPVLPRTLIPNLPAPEEDVSEWEVPFSVTIPGVPVPLAGRIDGLARHLDTGDLWVEEYKTTSVLTASWLENFTLHPQVVGYPHAACLMGFCPVGTIAHGLRKATSGKYETLSRPIVVTEQHYALYDKWVQVLWNRIPKEQEAPSNWPQMISGCTPFPSFGVHGWPCDFIHSCNSIPSLEEIVKTLKEPMETSHAEG